MGTVTTSEDSYVLRILQETLPITVWKIDRQGVFVAMEGNGLERLGMKTGQLVGQNVFDAFVEDPTLDFIRRALAGQHLHMFVDYSGMPWEAWYVPFRDGQGDVESILVISIDVSEAKHAESELRAQLALIERQHQVISALSTPIIEVWDKVLTLPMFGVIDSARVAQVMDSLLAEVSRKGARFAILDLTGVESVDTGTASHLLKLIDALRLLGAEGIITGIQPDVAQTMVMLGMNLEQVSTHSTLRAGLQRCIARMRSEAA
jgi:rsbT co-antagonist protein RsbR